MKTLSISKLTEFLKIVEAESDLISTNNSDDLLLFRGQDVDEALLPKNARRHLLHKKYGVPDRYDLHTNELMMLSEFKRRARPLLGQEPSSDWDWLTLAQHHGMDTRLLDWTENPLVALFFALESPDKDDTNRVIWLLKIKKSEIIVPSKQQNPFDLKRTMIFKPNIVSNRLAPQSGWFSVHKYMKGKDEFISLERNISYSRFLTKIMIKGKLMKMKQHLHLCGINASTLFPDLDGLCRHINLQREIDNMYYIKMPQPLKPNKGMHRTRGKARR